MDGEGPVAPVSDYDEFVDWDKRLATEGPFFLELFESHGVHSVIDVGAGSARHAILFAEWGLDVVAVDPDESMLAAARANVERSAGRVEAAGGSVRLVEGGFGELRRLGLGPADAITCTGNALPHVDGRRGLDDALEDFAAVLAPGGVVVAHLLNHARLMAGRIRVVPPKVVDTARGTTKVFVRLIDYPEGEESLDFDFVTLERDRSGSWTVSNRRSSHTALPLQVLEKALGRAGFSDVAAFGGHDRHPVSGTDESIIVVARRR